MTKPKVYALTYYMREHIFDGRGDEVDTCHYCGHDIRDDVHCTTERAQQLQSLGFEVRADYLPKRAWSPWRADDA